MHSERPKEIAPIRVIFAPFVKQQQTDESQLSQHALITTIDLAPSPALEIDAPIVAAPAPDKSAFVRLLDFIFA
jgi:hypothetical protein